MNTVLLKESEIQEIIKDIKSLRSYYFSFPPYSYAYDEKVEESYMSSLINSPNSVCIVLYENSRIIGLITGLPLNYCQDISNESKKKLSLVIKNIGQCFYIAEIIIEKKFRNKKFGNLLLKSIEKYANSINKTDLVLMSINNKKKEHTLWHKSGFKNTDIFEKMSWPTYQDNRNVVLQEHALHFWVKPILKET